MCLFIDYNTLKTFGKGSSKEPFLRNETRWNPTKVVLHGVGVNNGLNLKIIYI